MGKKPHEINIHIIDYSIKQRPTRHSCCAEMPTIDHVDDLVNSQNVEMPRWQHLLRKQVFLFQGQLLDRAQWTMNV